MRNAPESVPTEICYDSRLGGTPCANEGGQKMGEFEGSATPVAVMPLFGTAKTMRVFGFELV